MASRDVDKMSGKDIDRFWGYVRKEPNGCWIWTGYIGLASGRFRHGIMTITRNYKTFEIQARVVSFFLHFGRLPTNKLVTSCNNGLCVNPDHIFEGIVKYNPSTIEHVGDCHCTGKKCPECKEVLCIKRFTPDPIAPSGLRSTCHQCSNIRSKRHRLGMSRDEHETIIAKSGGKCAICGTESSDLQVDHDHDPIIGHTREMLCPRCNNRLRFVEGISPGTETWDTAPYKRYLKRHSGPFDLVEATSLLEGLEI